MKRMTLIKTSIFVLAFLGLAVFAKAQRASPAATATGIINGANITIKYSSPGVKGRTIYGTELVPYNEVWRAGANEATTFETDKDLKVEGKALPAGKYSIYAIASEKDWIIIFNSATGQWGINRDGTTTEDPAKDVIRVTVKPKKTTTLTERLIYTINKDGFVLSWEYLDIPVSIK
jgi:hypothetical protein